MAKIRITAPSPDHAQIGGVSSDQHHAIQHVITDGAAHTGSISDTQHFERTVANAHRHADLATIGVNDHHNDVHTIISHSDGSIVGVEATQAQIEAETAGVTFVPPDLLRHHPGVAKGWCAIVSTGGLRSPSYNVASVTDTGVGNRTVVWDDDFSGTIYVVVASIGQGGNESALVTFNTFAVGSIVHQLTETDDGAGNHQAPALADIDSQLAAFGDQ